MATTSQRTPPAATVSTVAEAPRGFRKLPIDSDGNLIEKDLMISSPQNLVNVSFPKMGKTDNMVNQPNFLIGDAEDGTAYFKARNAVNLHTYDGDKKFIKLRSGAYVPAGLWQTVNELNRINNMKAYWKLKLRLDDRLTAAERSAVYAETLACLKAMKFPIFVIDTITSIQLLNNQAALAEYNDTFSRNKTDIKRVDDYGGVQYIRRNFAGIKNFIETTAAPFIMWNGHVAMKKKVLKKGMDEISAVDIALDGILSNTFTSKADAVCVTYRNDEGVFMDFTKKEESDLGSRPEHLSNRVIKIADLHEYDEEGKLVKKGQTYWSRIYPELNW